MSSIWLTQLIFSSKVGEYGAGFCELYVTINIVWQLQEEGTCYCLLQYDEVSSVCWLLYNPMPIQAPMFWGSKTNELNQWIKFIAETARKVKFSQKQPTIGLQNSSYFEHSYCHVSVSKGNDRIFIQQRLLGVIALPSLDICSTEGSGHRHKMCIWCTITYIVSISCTDECNISKKVIAHDRSDW